MGGRGGGGRAAGSRSGGYGWSARLGAGILLLAIAFTVLPSGSAGAATFQATATLTPPAPTTVGSTPVPASVDFGTTFFSITFICFTVVFYR